MAPNPSKPTGDHIDLSQNLSAENPSAFLMMVVWMFHFENVEEQFANAKRLFLPEVI